MNDQLPAGPAPSIEEHARQSRPEPDGEWASRDWFHLVVFEWMWHEDGLALRPGAELMVYATVYRASAHGGGAYVATNASMGKLLGYPRETVNRVVGRLINAGLIWPVWRAQGSHGGRPVKCYAVCQPAIERAQRRMTAHRLESDVMTGGPVDNDADGDRITIEGSANVTERHIGNDDKSRHNVTKHHIGPLQCDKTSHSQCDEASHVTKRHIGKQGVPPADSTLFNIPLISTYHVSTDQGAKGDVEKPGEGTAMDAVSIPNAAVTV